MSNIQVTIPTLYPPIDVDTYAPREEMDKLLAHTQKQWEKLGEDPYKSVLDHQKFSLKEFEKNQEEFWASGESDYNRLKNWMQRNWVQPPESYVIELGCGTGRVTRNLGKHYNKVVACDVSSRHIALAKEKCAKHVEFIQLHSVEDLRALPPEAGLVFTVITLQHNTPPIMTMALSILLSKLAPGGLAFFQVTTYRKDYSFKIDDYLKKIKQGSHSGMEMHILPQHKVFSIIRTAECKVLEVSHDISAGDELVSTMFLVQKEGRWTH